MKQAVITSDIIRSTKLNATQRARLNQTLTLALRQWDSDFKAQSEIYRGDAVQILCKDISTSLTYALSLNQLINSLDLQIGIRISLAIGEVFNTETLALNNGEAFILSGRKLDELKNTKQSFAIITNDGYYHELHTSSQLLDCIIGDITPLQSMIILYKLLDYNELEISRAISISQSAVNQRSKGAKWYAIEKFINRFKRIYSED